MLSLSFGLDKKEYILSVITRNTRIFILKTAERLVKNCSSVDLVFELYSVVFR